MSKLQDKRKEKNLSQSDLAQICNIKKSTLQKYDAGFDRIEGASIEKLVSLALALDCKISEILEDPELVAQCEKLGI